METAVDGNIAQSSSVRNGNVTLTMTCECDEVKAPRHVAQSHMHACFRCPGFPSKPGQPDNCAKEEDAEEEEEEEEWDCVGSKERVLVTTRDSRASEQ
jgi:hypothetical protein